MPVIHEAVESPGGTELASSRERDFFARDFFAPDMDAHRWRGLGMYEVCTASLRVQPSRDNRAYFAEVDQGRKTGSSKKSFKLYLALTALLELRSRALIDVVIRPDDGAFRVDELAIPEHSLTVFDSDTAQPNALLGLVHAASGTRHFLAPGGERKNWRNAKILDARTNDALVEMRVPVPLREKLGLSTYTLIRAIDYHRPGYRSQTVLTSLIDPKTWPRHEISAIHAERWVSLVRPGQPRLGKNEMLHGEQAPAVLERLFAALTAYNLVREVLAVCAADIGQEPAVMDFAAALERLDPASVRAALDAGTSEPLHGLRAHAANLVRRPTSSGLELHVTPLG